MNIASILIPMTWIIRLAIVFILCYIILVLCVAYFEAGKKEECLQCGKMLGVKSYLYDGACYTDIVTGRVRIEHYVIK